MNCPICDSPIDSREIAQGCVFCESSVSQIAQQGLQDRSLLKTENSALKSGILTLKNELTRLRLINNAYEASYEDPASPEDPEQIGGVF